MPAPATGQTVGRYVLYDEIASGGMASVHMARLIGPAGFSRVVAAKRLHAAYAKDPDFTIMLLDEARLASRVRHPNVVPTLDVVAAEGELLLVMEYVPGETLARLLRASRRAGWIPPPNVVIRILIDVLRGLHAAHEARDASGDALRIVHRDVSPQNVLVGTDGSARLLDFGVAKAVSRVQTTHEGQLKGKLGYIAPEQISGLPVDRRADVFTASIVTWESIAGRRLFVGDDPGSTLAQVLYAPIPSLRETGCDVPEELDRAIARGLEREPQLRFESAEAMARELEAAQQPAPRGHISAWVEQLAGDVLAKRQEIMRRIEADSAELVVVQVPVDLASAGRSGNFASIRTALNATPEAQAPDAEGFDAGTLGSSLARSLVPPRRRWHGAGRVVLIVLGTLALGTMAGGWLFRGTGGGAERAAAPPSAAREPPPAGAPEPFAEAPSAAASVEPAPSSSRPSTTQSSPVPRDVAKSGRAKPPARASVAQEKPASKPAPVDPLADQR
jgi:eukaryotic-like serine/threonine-protein kinase